MNDESTMSRTTVKTIVSLWIAAACLAPASTAAFADDKQGGQAERTRPGYARESERPVPTEAPEADDLPEALRVQAFSETVPAVVEPPAAARTGPGHVPGHGRDDPALVEEAIRAADWAAEEMASTYGWNQYYRVGFHRGLRIALADDSLGVRDYMEGVRYGRRDPDARGMGVDLGRRAADDAAAGPALAQVERQFRDLYHEPRFDPRPVAPAYAVKDAWAAEPMMSEVFAEYPATRAVRIGRRATEALSGWDWDPVRLAQCQRYGDFYDAGWRDVQLAFDRWRDGDRRSANYRKRYSYDERARFRAIFEAELVRRLPSYYDRYLRAGHGEGFRDGWRYGAFVTSEWHYRRGYTEGFDEGVAAAAATGFQTAYPYAFEARYRDAFTEWSESPKPGIVSLQLSDADSDGIFQPGEEVLVDYELANYGGRDGTFTVVMQARELDRSQEVTVDLAARSTLRSDVPVRLRIDPRTPPRTRTGIDVLLAGEHDSVALLVSHPLELTREVDLDRDSVRGRATIRVLAVNRSRKPVAASVDLERVEGYPVAAMRRDLGVLPPGARDWAVFELDGLRPLDAVSGNVRTYFSVRSDGGVQDSMTFEFPDAVSDLRNRDLLELMVSFSRDPRVPWADVAEARALLLRRLEADWAAAVRGEGNPYKDDFRNDGSETALGDLVQTYLRHGSATRGSAVFEGLDNEIEDFAEELPGAHPFLRKYMKRLAKKLG